MEGCWLSPAVSLPTDRLGRRAWRAGSPEPVSQFRVSDLIWERCRIDSPRPSAPSPRCRASVRCGAPLATAGCCFGSPKVGPAKFSRAEPCPVQKASTCARSVKARETQRPQPQRLQHPTPERHQPAQRCPGGARAPGMLPLAPSPLACQRALLSAAGSCRPARGLLQPTAGILAAPSASASWPAAADLCPPPPPPCRRCPRPLAPSHVPPARRQLEPSLGGPSDRA